MTCAHPEFQAAVDVHRLTDGHGRPDIDLLELRVRCRVCGQPFGFVGPKPGVSFNGVSVTLHGDRLHIPIEPARPGAARWPELPPGGGA